MASASITRSSPFWRPAVAPACLKLPDIFVEGEVFADASFRLGMVQVTALEGSQLERNPIILYHPDNRRT